MLIWFLCFFPRVTENVPFSQRYLRYLRRQSGTISRDTSSLLTRESFNANYPPGSALCSEKAADDCCEPEVISALSAPAQLIIFILPLKTTTTRIDIYNAVKSYFVEKKVPLEKLLSVTTDGARAGTD